LLIEEQRTNSIRNNTMVGAVVGTPGTLPTNWSVASAAGLTTNVIGTGTSNGVIYVDLQVTGTSSATSYILGFDTTTQIAASAGQTWAWASWVAFVSGSLSNVTTVSADFRESNSGGTQLAAGTVALSTLTSSLVRQSATRTLSEATTAFIQPRLRLTIINGAAIDLTLRIGLPQLEQGAFATSPIPTTTTALTRALDVAVMTGTNFSSWYNQSEGTVSVAFDVYAPSVSDGFGRVYQINDGTSNNIIALLKNNGLGLEYFGLVRVAGLEQATLFTPAILANIPAKVATAYKLNDFAQSTNGGSVTTDTSGTIPTVTQMRIGSGTDVSVLNGHIRRITYFNRRLANSELQLLSS
jgi:hypothetical protein